MTDTSGDSDSVAVAITATIMATATATITTTPGDVGTSVQDAGGYGGHTSVNDSVCTGTGPAPMMTRW